MDHHHLAVELLAHPQFRVIALLDPLTEIGMATDSDEALFLLCPILGPSAVMILHRLSRYAANGPTTWEPMEFARTFGLASSVSTGMAAKAVGRLARFGFASINGSTLAVRTKVPSLPHCWLKNVPEYLRIEQAAA